MPADAAAAACNLHFPHPFDGLLALPEVNITRHAHMKLQAPQPLLSHVTRRRDISVAIYIYIYIYVYILYFYLYFYVHCNRHNHKSPPPPLSDIIAGGGLGDPPPTPNI